LILQRVPRRRKRAGVGLLVVLLILALIALVTGIAVPAFFAQPEVTLDNACILLVRDIRSAQNRAAWSGTDTLIAFDHDGGGYRMVDLSGRLVERLGSLGSYERRFDDEGVFEGVHISRIVAGADNALCFDSKKRNWEGGEVELTFDGESRVVRIAARTGEVSIVGLKRPWTSEAE
jgi:hypothetical protein